MTVTKPPKKSSALAAIPWLGIGAVALVAGLSVFFWFQTRLPERIVIAGGQEGGRYAELAKEIAAELERRLSTDVEVRTTTGSMENMELLQTNEVSLGLYQSGAAESLETTDRTELQNSVAFVGNLYSEFLLPFRQFDAAASNDAAPTQSAWSQARRFSGDTATMRLLLEHLGIDEKAVQIAPASFAELPMQLRSGETQIGVVCCGLDAPALATIATSDGTQLIPIPAPDAFALKHSTLQKDIIPAGYFSTSPMLPASEFHTVSLHAQLLAQADAPVKLTEEVTRIVLDADFQRRNRLTDLLDFGVGYAVSRPEFDMHDGASHVYYPELKPLVNPDFVEGTEGLRSFFVSLVAAIWLLRRWWKRKQVRSQEHRLDRYIRELLRIERDQMDVDGDGGPSQSGTLQQLLDRVTLLRQEALAEFSAHEINDDNAVGCFIHMCHALSEKLNAKLIRHSVLNAGDKPQLSDQ